MSSAPKKPYYLVRPSTSDALVKLTKQFTTDAPRVLSERYLELMRRTWERDAVNKKLREMKADATPAPTD